MGLFTVAPFRYKWIFLIANFFFTVLKGDRAKLQTCKIIRAALVSFFNSRKLNFFSSRHGTSEDPLNRHHARSFRGLSFE